jgi:hypothetical protein
VGRKSSQIVNSELLLKIDPPQKELNKYLRGFLLLVFSFFSAAMFYIIPQILQRQTDIIILAVAYVSLCILLIFILLRLKPTPLVFTDRGITDSTFFSAFWNEIQFYNFVSIPEIGPNKCRKTLRLISNKPPFYQLTFFYRTRYFYDRGLFFSEEQIAKAKDIFKTKGISKEP